MGIYFRIKKQLGEFCLEVEHTLAAGVLVIQGESGAGKTTVLNCIAGLKTPDEGLVEIGGQTMFDGRGINVPVRRRNIGYLFQHYALFPNLTVEKNVLYGLKNKPEYRDRTQRAQLLEYAEHTMETFRISHLRKRFPQNLSGGEQQRAALARALVTRPSLLLLDEPFSALDQQTKETVYEEFARIKQHLSIPTILITHDPNESRLFADDVMIMRQGRAV